MMPLGIKNGLTPGVTSLNQRNKDVEFICGEMTRVSDQGPSLLVTSNFSFFHSVFKRLVSQGCQKVSLCGNGLNTPGKNKAVENIVRKGENAGNQHFFHNFFYLSHGYFVVCKCFEF